MLGDRGQEEEEGAQTGDLETGWGGRDTHLGSKDATVEGAGGLVIEKVKLQHAQCGCRSGKTSMKSVCKDRCVCVRPVGRPAAVRLGKVSVSL